MVGEVGDAGKGKREDAKNVYGDHHHGLAEPGVISSPGRDNASHRLNATRD